MTRFLFQGFIEIEKLIPSSAYQLVIWSSNSVGTSPVTEQYFLTPPTAKGKISLKTGELFLIASVPFTEANLARFETSSAVRRHFAFPAVRCMNCAHCKRGKHGFLLCARRSSRSAPLPKTTQEPCSPVVVCGNRRAHVHVRRKFYRGFGCAMYVTSETRGEEEDRYVFLVVRINF